MDMLSTFLYFLPLLTVVLIGVVLIGLVYNIHLDRKASVQTDSTETASPDTQAT